MAPLLRPPAPPPKAGDSYYLQGPGPTQDAFFQFRVPRAGVLLCAVIADCGEEYLDELVTPDGARIWYETLIGEGWHRVHAPRCPADQILRRAHALPPPTEEDPEE